jgi:protein gp37
MAADWAMTIRDYAVEHGIPFFFKGMGGVRASLGSKQLAGVEWQQFPRELWTPQRGS